MMLEHNDEGDEKNSFELLTNCQRWVVLRWLARIISFKDTWYTNDAIWVVVDRLIKSVHFLAINLRMSMAKLA